MKVLIVASEAHPFIKTGGLGDVIGALPVALNDLGADVRVVIPNYRDIKKEIKENLQFMIILLLNVGWRNQYCGVIQYEYKVSVIIFQIMNITLIEMDYMDIMMMAKDLLFLIEQFQNL